MSNREKEFMPHALWTIVRHYKYGWIDTDTASARIDAYYKRNKLKRRRLVKLHGSNGLNIRVIRERAAGLSQPEIAERICRSKNDDPLRLIQRIEKQFREAVYGVAADSMLDRHKRRQEYCRALNYGAEPHARVSVCTDNNGKMTLLTGAEVFKMLEERFNPELIEFLNQQAKK